VPWGLKRFHESGQTHFITFCCFRRRQHFVSDSACKCFAASLERVRRSYRVRVLGYVIMPEHVHLLVSEPGRATLAAMIQAVSRRLIGDAEHFWQKRYYDFNVRTYDQFIEKLRYIHRNPVKRVCAHPEDWECSSFRHYATGSEGPVEIESEWTARRRERLAGQLCQPQLLPLQD